MSSLFQDCSTLMEVKGIKNLRTGNTKDMSNMFRDCIQLRFLDL